MYEQPREEHIVSDFQESYLETQKEILAIETRKARNKLFAIAAVFFVSDLIALLSINAVNPSTLLIILIVPAAILLLSFLSTWEPLLSMVLAALVVIGVWAYVIWVLGAQGAVSGWLTKGLVVYLVIAGFQSASEAQRIKRELKTA